MPVLICTDDLTMLEHLVLLLASIKSSFKSYSAYISISCSVPTMTSLTCLAEKREGGKEEQLSFAAELQTLHFSKLQL